MAGTVAVMAVTVVLLSHSWPSTATCVDPKAIEVTHNPQGIFLELDPCLAHARPVSNASYRLALRMLIETPTFKLAPAAFNHTLQTLRSGVEQAQPIASRMPVCTRAHSASCFVRGETYEFLDTNGTVVFMFTVSNSPFPLDLPTVATTPTRAHLAFPTNQLPADFTSLQVNVCLLQHGSDESPVNCDTSEEEQRQVRGLCEPQVALNFSNGSELVVPNLRPWSTYCAGVTYRSTNYDVGSTLSFTTNQTAFSSPPVVSNLLERTFSLILRLRAHPADIPWPSEAQTFRVTLTSEYGETYYENEALPLKQNLQLSDTGVEAFAREPTSPEIVFTIRFANLPPYTCFNSEISVDSGEHGISPVARVTRHCTLAGPPLRPDPPVIDGTNDDGMLRVSWPRPARLQAPLLSYELVANVEEEKEILGAIVARAGPRDTEAMVDTSSVDIVWENKTFNIRLRVVNIEGVSPLSALAFDPNNTHALVGNPPPLSSDSAYTPGAVLGPAAVVLTCVLLGIALITLTQRRLEKLHVLTLPPPDEWERPRSDVMIGVVSGTDIFGEEFDGTLRQKQGPGIGISVRRCNVNKHLDEKEAFLEEVIMLKELGKDRHPNIVNIVGCCLQEEPLLLFVEQTTLGNLRKYLHQFSPLLTDNTLTLPERLKMMHDIAAGMGYLHHKDITHRDLAARNCYVTTTGTVKLTGFGRERYTPMGDGTTPDFTLMPVRWMGPEAFVLPNCTFGMDVWAFGVTAWEIETYGRLPYTTLTNEQVCSYVVRGQRLDQPPDCPLIIYEMMLCCWASIRPNFVGISEFLKEVARLVPSQESNTAYRVTPITDFVDDDTADILLDRLQRHAIRESRPASPRASRSAVSTDVGTTDSVGRTRSSVRPSPAQGQRRGSHSRHYSDVSLSQQLRPSRPSRPSTAPSRKRASSSSSQVGESGKSLGAPTTGASLGMLASPVARTHSSPYRMVQQQQQQQQQQEQAELKAQQRRYRRRRSRTLATQEAAGDSWPEARFLRSSRSPSMSKQSGQRLRAASRSAARKLTTPLGMAVSASPPPPPPAPMKSGISSSVSPGRQYKRVSSQLVPPSQRKLRQAEQYAQMQQEEGQIQELQEETQQQPPQMHVQDTWPLTLADNGTERTSLHPATNGSVVEVELDDFLQAANHISPLHSRRGYSPNPNQSTNDDDDGTQKSTFQSVI